MLRNERARRETWARAATACAALVGSMLALAAPAHAVEDPWAPGTGWLSVRAGYSKVASRTAPNGGVGYGFGFARMLPGQGILGGFSLGGYVHHEVRGRTGAATVLDVPFTLELARHFKSSGVAPYVGFGYGAYYLKKYRYPNETYTLTKGGASVMGGANAKINSNSMLGADVRLDLVTIDPEETRWGLKLNYSWVY
jgi:hypothetical protein